MHADSSAFQFVRESAPASVSRFKQREIPVAATCFRASGDISSQLYVKVENLEGSLLVDEPADISIRCELRVGDTVIGVQRSTSSIPRTLAPRWDELLAFGVSMKDLPSSTTLHVRAHSMCAPSMSRTETSRC